MSEKSEELEAAIANAKPFPSLRDMAGHLDGMWDELAEKMGLKGWVYRDIPRVTPEAFQMLMDLLGEDNVTWLAQTHGKDADGVKFIRGQCFISPAGIERAKASTKGERA